MSLFSVVVDIAARTASIEAGVKKSGDLLEQFGQTTKRVGAMMKGALEFAGITASIGEAVHMFEQFTEHAAQMKLASQQTGLAVEQFSRLEFAAKQTGVASDQLSAGLKEFARFAGEAAGGSQQYAAAFRAIGVAVTNSRGQLRPMGDLLSDVADKFASYQDGTAKAALAQQLFGRAGAELIPLLDQGAKGIKAYGDRLDALGGTIKKTTADGAEKFLQKMNEVHGVVGGLEQSIEAALLPSLNGLLDHFNNTAASAQAFQTVGEDVAAGVKILETVFIGLGGLLKTDGDMLGAMGAALVNLVEGNFRDAANIAKEGFKDFASNVAGTAKAVESVWDEAGKTIDKVGNKAEADGKKLVAPIVQLGRQMHAVKSFADQLNASLDRLTESTDALVSRRSMSLTDSVGNSNARQISQQHDQWLKANQGMVDTTKKSTDQMTVFADQAARNIQSSFATFLFDPFRGGVKGMLVSFIDTIRQMLAQAAAADMLKALFGASGSGGNGLGGVLGGLLGALAGGASGSSGFGQFASGAAADSAVGSDFSLSGAFAGGGYATSGKSYLVGEQGPEIFTPGAGGYVTPNGVGTGHLHYNSTFNIDARGADADRIMTVLPPVMHRMIAQSKYDLLQAFRRSGLPAPLRA